MSLWTATADGLTNTAVHKAIKLLWLEKKEKERQKRKPGAVDYKT